MDEENKIQPSAEIQKALKEFETKSAESYKAVKFYNQTNTPRIVKLAMKLSGVKDERKAEYILFGFVIVAVVVSLFLLLRGGKQTSPVDIKNIDQSQYSNFK